ncbi:MAG: anti-sigma factor [Gammaproteobacteria bacterium]
MKYENPELRDLLAGEYVLGQLRGRARARFERLVLARPDFARAVAAWEERFAPLAQAVAPVTPPRRVWRRVSRRIKMDAVRSGQRRTLSGWFGNSGFALAGVAAAAFFVMLGLYLARPAVTPAPNQVAVIATAKGTPQWVITVRDKHMQMRAVGQVTAPVGKSYQLWMLPGHGAKPVSLGLLPVSGSASEALTATMLAVLKSASGLAVSIEPAGGSPTGQPTGPVVYTAQIANI